MKTVGIIAEFNPFHNGHEYIIKKAKEITNAQRAIIVMSGNYIQRGGPAFMDKYQRTLIALNNGADIVIELPVCYSMSSASYFAYGAVNILNSLNCVDYLCFGCENNNIEELKNISQIISNDEENYNTIIKLHLKMGTSFCKSRELALKECLSKVNKKEDNIYSYDFLNQPNSILGIEYLVSLNKLNSKIIPKIVTRIDKGYHSLEITNKTFASASGIRKFLLDTNNLDEVKNFIPDNSLELLKNSYQKSFPIYENDFSEIIGYNLLFDQIENSSLSKTFDISDFVANRIENNLKYYTSVSDFISRCNSKSITSSYLRRGLFNIILGYTKEDYNLFSLEGGVFYYRILGFNKKHQDILKTIKTNSSFPLITKLTNLPDSLSDTGRKMLELNLKADRIYRMVAMNKYGNYIKNEYENGVVILS